MLHFRTLNDAIKQLTSEEHVRSCVITDPHQADNPIVYVTREFELQTGYSKADVIGRNCRFLQGPDTDPAAVEQIRNAVRTLEPLRVGILNYRKDGTPFWNTLSMRPTFEADGSIRSFVAVQYCEPRADYAGVLKRAA